MSEDIIEDLNLAFKKDKYEFDCKSPTFFA